MSLRRAYDGASGAFTVVLDSVAPATVGDDVAGCDTVTAVDYAAALPLEGFGPFSIGSALGESSLAWNGPARSRRDPTGIYRDEPGEPVDLGLELTWSTDGSPYHYDFTTRYEIPCNIAGFLTIDGVRVQISGAG